jgi:hypothetical protein
VIGLISDRSVNVIDIVNSVMLLTPVKNSFRDVVNTSKEFLSCIAGTVKACIDDVIDLALEKHRNY